MFIIVAFMAKVELCIFFRNSYVIDVFFIKINKFRSSLLRNRKQLNSPDLLIQSNKFAWLKQYNKIYQLENPSLSMQAKTHTAFPMIESKP